MEFEIAVTVLTAAIVFTVTLRYGLSAIRDAEYSAERKVQMKLDRERWGGGMSDAGS